MTTRTATGTGGTTATLTYDGQDHLVRWNDTNTTSNEEWYLYNASGQRVLRRSQQGGASNTTLTVYAFGLEEHQYGYTGSGSSATNTGNTYYYSLGGHLIGTSNGTSTNFLLTDALGSVVSSLSNTANSAVVNGNQTYGPYGNQAYSKGTVGTAKGYTGQYNDALTQLDYYGARYYDPFVGAFLSADTVQGNPQGSNPYSYAGTNPETNTDPTGEMYAPPPGGGEGVSGPSWPPPVLPPTNPPYWGLGGTGGKVQTDTCSSMGSMGYGCHMHTAANGNTTATVVTSTILGGCGGFMIGVAVTCVPNLGQSVEVTHYQSTVSLSLCLPLWACSDHGGSSNDAGSKTDWSDVLASDESGTGGSGDEGLGRPELFQKFVEENLDTIFGQVMGAVESTNHEIVTSMGRTDVDIMTDSKLVETTTRNFITSDGNYDTAMEQSFITKMQKYRLYSATSEGAGRDISVAYDQDRGLTPLIERKLTQWGINFKGVRFP